MPTLVLLTLFSKFCLIFSTTRVQQRVCSTDSLIRGKVGCYPGAIAPELAHSAATGGVVGNEREAIAYSMAKL